MDGRELWSHELNGHSLQVSTAVTKPYNSIGSFSAGFHSCHRATQLHRVILCRFLQLSQSHTTPSGHSLQVSTAVVEPYNSIGSFSAGLHSYRRALQLHRVILCRSPLCCHRALQLHRVILSRSPLCCRRALQLHLVILFRSLQLL